MQILDITDAMLIKRLVETLLKLGVKFVITSNRHPNNLYLHGLNRHLFLPFIKELGILFFPQWDQDYRTINTITKQHFLSPIHADNNKLFKSIWNN